MHLLCKKHFIDCFFVLSVIFEKFLEKSTMAGEMAQNSEIPYLFTFNDFILIHE